MMTDINYLVDRLNEQIQFWTHQHMPERAIDSRKARDTLMELENIRLSAERFRTAVRNNLHQEFIDKRRHQLFEVLRAPDIRSEK